MKIIKTGSKNKGFTILEMTATLLIVAMLSGLAGLFITNVVRAYAMYQENKEVAQKARFVINRLVNEFVHITKVIKSSETQIQFISRFNNQTEMTIKYEKNTLKIDNVMKRNIVFADKIYDFKLRYTKSDEVFDDINKNIWTNKWTDKSTAIQFDISFIVNPYLKTENKKHIVTFYNITTVPRFLESKK